MRRILPIIVILSLALTACVDRGGGASPRGTIDGVTLREPTKPTEPPGTATAPRATDQAATDPTAADPATSNPTGDTEVPTTDPTASVFGWRPVNDTVDEGSLDVPLDYARPGDGTVTLYLERHRAVDPATRIGTLLVNPGGPGFGGSSLAENADQIYGQGLLDRFDIIGWDPRGTGRSTPAVDCIDEYDPFFSLDSSPDTPAERRALIDQGTAFGAACEKRSGKILPFISTESSADDINEIRRSLGEARISYFGFSYGSELGATWLTKYPNTVRAAVIDGAVDPTANYLQQNIQQAAGFDATFTTFLAQCSASADCAFHNNGKAEQAFDDLSNQIDVSPLRSALDRPLITQGVLSTAVAQAMYSQSEWPSLEKALADAQSGDGAGLLDLYDSYYGRNTDHTYDNSLEAYFAIGCLDDPGSTGPDDLYSHEAEFAKAAPRLGRGWMAELTFCSVWPEKSKGQPTITGKGAGPVVVVGTTGDPATPLASTRKMADTLQDGRLIIVTADQHTGYGVNDCVNSAVDGYLVDPTSPPADGLDCG